MTETSFLGQFVSAHTVGIALVSVIGLVFLSRWRRKAGGKPGPVLHASRSKEYQEFKLVEKKRLTSGVQCPVTLYRFALPHKEATLGLPTGQHISLKGIIDGEEVVRYYTPTTPHHHKGHFDLVIKVYPQGKMSQYIDKLAIGDSILVSGPKGLHVYKRNQSKHLGLIAGGTGITPCYQLIQQILDDPEDHTQVSLLYGNLTEDDIIIRDMIDAYAQKFPQQFQVYHVLNHPPDDWEHGKGFITKDMIKERFAAPEDDVRVGMCGPPVMCKVMRAHLKELGYKKDQIYSY